jgi:hypothetical protein
MVPDISLCGISMPLFVILAVNQEGVGIAVSANRSRYLS